MAWRDRAKAEGLRQRDQARAAALEQQKRDAATRVRFEAYRVTFEQFGRDAAEVLRDAQVPYAIHTEVWGRFSQTEHKKTRCWELANLWLHRSGKWRVTPFDKPLRLELSTANYTNARLWQWSGTSLVWPYTTADEQQAFYQFDEVIERGVIDLLGRS